MTESKMHSRYLYHFTKPDSAIRILKGGIFKPGTLSNCNDPFESKDWNFSVKPAGMMLPELSKQATEILRRGWHVLCMSSDRPTDDPSVVPGATIAPMWAHYAANHRGVCLVFNSNRLHKAVIESGNGRIVSWGFVKYSLESQPTATKAFMLNEKEFQEEGLEAHLSEHSGNHYQELFLTKHPAWAYEQEFRWLIHSPDDAVTIPIGTSIRGIIVGADCVDDDAEQLAALGRTLKLMFE